MNKRGVALYIVLAVLLVVVILTDVILGIMSSQSKLTNHQVRRIQAYYAVRGAVNYAFEQLRVNASGWVPGSSSLVKYMCKASSCSPYTADVVEPDLPASIRYIKITIDPYSPTTGLTPVTAVANYTGN